MAAWLGDIPVGGVSITGELPFEWAGYPPNTVLHVTKDGVVSSDEDPIEVLLSGMDANTWVLELNDIEVPYESVTPTSVRLTNPGLGDFSGKFVSLVTYDPLWDDVFMLCQADDTEIGTDTIADKGRSGNWDGVGNPIMDILPREPGMRAPFWEVNSANTNSGVWSGGAFGSPSLSSFTTYDFFFKATSTNMYVGDIIGNGNGGGIVWWVMYLGVNQMSLYTWDGAAHTASKTGLSWVVGWNHGFFMTVGSNLHFGLNGTLLGTEPRPASPSNSTDVRIIRVSSGRDAATDMGPIRMTAGSRFPEAASGTYDVPLLPLGTSLPP